MFVTLLEELADAFGGLAAFGIDVPPCSKSGILVAATFLDEVMFAGVVVVHTLPVGDFFLSG